MTLRPLVSSETLSVKPLRVFDESRLPFRVLLSRHEIVNINLKTKPEWYLAKSATGGKVPALELDGNYVPESLITSDLLEELYPEPALYPKDPWRKAEDRLLVEIFGGVRERERVRETVLHGRGSAGRGETEGRQSTDERFESTATMSPWNRQVSRESSESACPRRPPRQAAAPPPQTHAATPRRQQPGELVSSDPERAPTGRGETLERGAPITLLSESPPEPGVGTW